MSDQSVPVVVDPSGSDIHGENVRLREQGRATRVRLPGGVVAWAITDHDLIKRLLTDSRVSRDAYQHWPAWENGEGELAKSWSMAQWVSERNMLTAYGTEHTRLRKLVAKAFTARRTVALRPRIEAITCELLDQLAATPHGQVVDIRAEFAYPLPIQVICELLGIPAAMRKELLRMVGEIFRTSVSVEDAQANVVAMYALMGELVAVRREDPGDDLASALISARDEDGASGLSELELIDTLILMIGAGHETTVNLLDHAIHTLLTHPAQLRLVRAGEASWGDVIDEVLRLEAPIANLPMRYAVERIELDDVTIAKGDAMIISFAAAGRDTLVHGDTADRFDITRPTRRDHLAFGHGVHHCLGAPLARCEASIALPALFSRFPDLACAVPADQLRLSESFISNGHLALPVLLGSRAVS